MLRRLLSILGIVFIGLSLAGFLLPRSMMRLPPQIEPNSLTFNEGDEGVPSPSPSATPSTTPAPSPTTTFSPTPRPSASPLPSATPLPTTVPTPRPTPAPTPKKFDEFGIIRRDDVSARMDNFADELQSNPAAQGYIIAYGGRRGAAGEAQRLADFARDYLVKTRGIDAGRLVRLNGGFKEEAVIEFWIVPRGSPPPTASSMVDAAPGTPAQLEKKRRTHEETAKSRGEDSTTDGSDSASSVAYIKTQSVISESSRLEIEYPRELKKTDTGVVRVTIIREPNAATTTPTTDIPGNVVTQAAAEHCNTPRPGLRNAYGAQYEATATAKLDSSSFDARASTTEPQTLDPSRVTWQWSITPKSVGSQAANLTVTVQWKRRGTSQTKPSCKILDRSLPIHVTESLLSDSNILKAQAVLGLVGVFLQLPIFVWRKKKEEK